MRPLVTIPITKLLVPLLIPLPAAVMSLTTAVNPAVRLSGVIRIRSRRLEYHLQQRLSGRYLDR
jgi:hypothetical protein